MAIPPGYDKDWLITTRYWISQTIKNMSKANLPRELVIKMHTINESIDDIMFNSENGYTKWARSLIPEKPLNDVKR